MVLVLVMPFALPAQVVLKSIPANEIPKGMSYKGTVQKAVSWADTLGKHFVILAEEGPVPSKDKKDSLGFCEEEECKDKYLYAYHFVQGKDSVQIVWKVMDYEKQCSFDLYASFETRSLTVTDLNKDGIPETWFIYKTTCTSDVSPRTMKLFMIEGNKKHIIRGSSRVKISSTEYLGGERKFDSNFNMSSQPVKDFAVKLWDKFVKDTYN